MSLIKEMLIRTPLFAGSKSKAAHVLSATRGGLAALFADSRHAGIPVVVASAVSRTVDQTSSSATLAKQV